MNYSRLKDECPPWDHECHTDSNSMQIVFFLLPEPLLPLIFQLLFLITVFNLRPLFTIFNYCRLIIIFNYEY